MAMVKKRFVLISLLHFLLLSFLIVVFWQEGWEWWRILVIIGACFILPIVVGFVGQKLPLLKAPKQLRMVVNTLRGMVLLGGVSTLLSFLSGTFDRLVRHLIVWIIGYLTLGVVYALAIETLMRKR